jgi:hypothetical protein
MTYTRAYTTWQDKPNLTTPVNAAILQNMEQGIYDGFVYQTGNDVRFVAGTGTGGVSGSDSNDGLHPSKSFATIQAAYNSCSSRGGTIILLPGAHNVGSGFVGTNNKIGVFRSVSGARDGLAANNAPVITGTGASLFTMSSAGPSINQGWSFFGLEFDIRNANNLRAIQVNDINMMTVERCNCYGVTGVEKYMVRSNYPLFDDASWYRLGDNRTQYCGIADLGSGESVGNSNQHVIANNIIFAGNTSWGMKLFNAQRCSIYANNIEGNGPGGIKLTGASKYNYIHWNGGEGSITPYVEFGASCTDNAYFNWGSSGFALRVAASDLNGNNYLMARSGFQFMVGDVTGDLTLDPSYQSMNTTYVVNKATAVTITVPPNSTVPWGIGKQFAVRQKGAGQVTLAPGAGVTLRSRSGLKTAGQYAMISCVKVAADEWQVYGDTTT